MTMARVSGQSDVSAERIGRAVFIGFFFAPVAGTFTGALLEIIRHWNAEPGGLWFVPILIGLESGFLRGSFTGLTLGILTGWQLSAMPLERATGVFFIAMLFASVFGAILQAVFTPMFSPGTINVVPLAAYATWAAGYCLIGMFLLRERIKSRSSQQSNVRSS